MQFGVCTSIDQADQAKRYGWDFVELNVQQAFQGTVADDAFKPLSSSLPTPAANSLVPGAMKIVGPDVKIAVLADYLHTVMRRAAAAGCETLVFGSGVARMIPDGFDRGQAAGQLVDFLNACATAAHEHGITIVVEPLNRGETNVLNTLDDCVTLVRAVNRPNVRQLVDSFHFWLEDDTLDAIRDAGPLIRHVHVADRQGRVPPGESGTSDYRPMFRALKEIGYDARASVECAGWNWTEHGDRVLAFLKSEWDAA